MTAGYPPNPPGYSSSAEPSSSSSARPMSFAQQLYASGFADNGSGDRTSDATILRPGLPRHAASLPPPTLPPRRVPQLPARPSTELPVQRQYSDPVPNYNSSANVRQPPSLPPRRVPPHSHSYSTDSFTSRQRQAPTEQHLHSRNLSTANQRARPPGSVSLIALHFFGTPIVTASVLPPEILDGLAAVFSRLDSRIPLSTLQKVIQGDESADYRSVIDVLQEQPHLPTFQPNIRYDEIIAALRGLQRQADLAYLRQQQIPQQAPPAHSAQTAAPTHSTRTAPATANTTQTAAPIPSYEETLANLRATVQAQIQQQVQQTLGHSPSSLNYPQASPTPAASSTYADPMADFRAAFEAQMAEAIRRNTAAMQMYSSQTPQYPAIPQYQLPQYTTPAPSPYTPMQNSTQQYMDLMNAYSNAGGTNQFNPLLPVPGGGGGGGVDQLTTLMSAMGGGGGGGGVEQLIAMMSQAGGGGGGGMEQLTAMMSGLGASGFDLSSLMGFMGM